MADRKRPPPEKERASPAPEGRLSKPGENAIEFYDAVEYLTIAFVMFIIISIRYTLHVLLLGDLANGTYL